MGMMANLAGQPSTRTRVWLHAWGCGYAEVSLDGEHELSGAVDLKLADLTLSGTVLSGGPAKGRSDYRIVGGKGGWGRTIPSKSYADDAGTKLAKVLGDAARDAGETLDVTTIASTARVGPNYTRPEGPASRVLEREVPSRWYVGEDGVTRIGARPPTTLRRAVQRIGQVDLARGTATVASETIADIVPGVEIDGLTAVDVMHEVTPDGLRSRIWGPSAVGTSGPLAGLRVLLDQIDPNRAFRGLTEYRVVLLAGARLDLQPVLRSSGMPVLERVPMRPGVAGVKSTLALGARVLVGFVNADPGRPVVTMFEDSEGEGFLPLLTEIDARTFVKLADGVRPMAATGDLAGGIWPIVGTTRVMG